jgi:hypothetical protein
MRATNLPESDSRPLWKIIFGVEGDKTGKSRKYGLYLFVIAILIMIISILVLLNAYFHLVNVSSYNINKGGCRRHIC